MKRRNKYIYVVPSHYRSRKRKRQIGGFFSFDPSKPFKGSKLGYLTKKIQKFCESR